MRVELSNDWKTAAAVFMTHWIHHLDPVAIPLHGDFGIRWYGLAYAAAFLIGGWLLRAYHRHGRSPLDETPPDALPADLAAGYAPCFERLRLGALSRLQPAVADQVLRSLL